MCALSAASATIVAITGTDLDRTTAVRFNGTSSSFSLYSATQVNATVPVGATTGPITVTTTGGAATTAGNFVVIQPPTIAGFSPASGLVNSFAAFQCPSLPQPPGSCSARRDHAIRISLPVIRRACYASAPCRIAHVC